VLTLLGEAKFLMCIIKYIQKFHYALKDSGQAETKF
jgi:hypothetical protein